MDVHDLSLAEDRQNLVFDHRPVGLARRRRFARQILSSVSFGEVFDRRSLAGLAPFARRVLALVDPLAKSFRLDPSG